MIKKQEQYIHVFEKFINAKIRPEDLKKIANKKKKISNHMFGNTFFPQSFHAPVYSHQIYVGDIPITVSEEQIYFYFQTYGRILYLKTGVNRKSKKFAFISFEHQDSGILQIFY